MQVLLRLALLASLVGLAMGACDPSTSRTANSRDGGAARDYPQCRFQLIDMYGWEEVEGSRRSVSMRLPRGARRVSTAGESNVEDMWSFAAGNVSLSVNDWGPEWQDSVRADFAESWPLCADSVSGRRVGIKSRFAAPHPFGQGQFLIAYFGLELGEVLVVRAFAEDSSARDSLFTIVTGLTIKE